MKFQRRSCGVLEYHESFLEALREEYDKISFGVDGGRLILRSDGTWDYLNFDSEEFSFGRTSLEGG